MNEVPIQNLTAEQRIKELTKRKKKLLSTLRTSKKKQVKARMEKRRINEELRMLKGKTNLFKNMTEQQARDAVRLQIESVSPADVYPKDLERKFDKLEAPSKKDFKVVDLGRIPERTVSVHREDDPESVGYDQEEYPEEEEEGVVVDLSDQ